MALARLCRQRAVFGQLAHGHLPSARAASSTQAFDQDKDGFITRDEFRRALLKDCALTPEDVTGAPRDRLRATVARTALRVPQP